MTRRNTKLKFQIPALLVAMIWVSWIDDFSASASEAIDNEASADSLIGTQINVADWGLPLRAQPLEQPISSPSSDVRIVNVFGSWCGPCILEHPLLMTLNSEGMAIVGIEYRDNPDEAAQFLKTRGNPYGQIWMDPEGASDTFLGINSIPHTLVIDQDNVVLWHKRGRLKEEDLPVIRSVARGHSVETMQVRSMALEDVTARLASRLEQEPEDVDGWILLGRAYQELDQIVLSTMAFAKARALAPDRQDIPGFHQTAATPGAKTAPADSRDKDGTGNDMLYMDVVEKFEQTK